MKIFLNCFLNRSLVTKRPNYLIFLIKYFLISIDSITILLLVPLIYYWTARTETALGGSIVMPAIIASLNFLMIFFGHLTNFFFQKKFEDKIILKVSKITYSLGWWILLSMPIAFIFLF
jgi:hypothetical protein